MHIGRLSQACSRTDIDLSYFPGSAIDNPLQTGIYCSPTAFSGWWGTLGGAQWGKRFTAALDNA